MTVHHQPPRLMAARRVKPIGPKVKPKPVEGTRPKARPFGVTGKRVPETK
jgi:hypothetical protein